MVTKRQVKSKKSKRIPTHKKMKLARKINQAKKKMKKQYRKEKALGKIRHQKGKLMDVVPNSFPQKADFLQNMIEYQRQQKEINDQKSIYNSKCNKEVKDITE